MRRPLGIVLTSALLVALAVSLLGRGGHPPSGNPIQIRLVRDALAVLSVVAAVALWQRWPRAMAAYAGWAVAYLGLGAALEIGSGSAEPVEAAIGILLVGAVLTALGVHLRWVLRQGHTERAALER